MDQKQDDKVKYEKLKLHIIYLLTISSILVVIAVSIALGGNDDALGQISMASTVSSIILSSIAIFMSISGENKLSYTHNKLVETSDRMSDITANIEEANRLLDNTINQFIKIDDISDRLKQIGQSVDYMQNEMFNRTIHFNKNSSVNISSENIWNVYDNMLTGISDRAKKAIQGLMEYIVICASEQADLNSENVEKYLKLVTYQINESGIGILWGVIYVFVSMGITNIDTIKYFEEKMAISEEKKNEIKKFL